MIFVREVRGDRATCANCGAPLGVPAGYRGHDRLFCGARPCVNARQRERYHADPGVRDRQLRTMRRYMQRRRHGTARPELESWAAERRARIAAVEAGRRDLVSRWEAGEFASQRAMARALGVPRSTIQSILAGTRRPYLTQPEGAAA